VFASSDLTKYMIRGVLSDSETFLQAPFTNEYLTPSTPLQDDQIRRLMDVNKLTERTYEEETSGTSRAALTSSTTREAVPGWVLAVVKHSKEHNDRRYQTHSDRK
jgi:hypothetical protein